MSRRAFYDGLLIEDRSMHDGIRGSVYDKDDFLRDHELGFRIIRCTSRSTSTCLTRRLPPGTGTPEIGGLYSREIF